MPTGKIERIIKRLLIYIGAVLFLQGCVPSLGLLDKEEKKALRAKKRCQKRYDKFKDRCPENVRIDTFTVEIPVQVDSQLIAKEFAVDQDFSGIDSIILRYQDSLNYLGLGNDSLSSHLLGRAGRDIIRYVRSRKIISDTFRLDTVISLVIDDIAIQVKIQIGVTQPTAQTIAPFVYVPSQELTLGITRTEETITRPELTWKEKIYEGWKDFWWVFGGILILYIVYRTFKTAIRGFLGLK